MFWAYTIPADFPESDGTFEWDCTTLIVVEAHGGGESGLDIPTEIWPLRALSSESWRRPLLDCKLECWPLRTTCRYQRKPRYQFTLMSAVRSTRRVMWSTFTITYESPRCSFGGSDPNGFLSATNSFSRKISWAEPWLQRAGLQIVRWRSPVCGFSPSCRTVHF